MSSLLESDIHFDIYAALVDIQAELLEFAQRKGVENVGSMVPVAISLCLSNVLGYDLVRLAEVNNLAGVDVAHHGEQLMCNQRRHLAQFQKTLFALLDQPPELNVSLPCAIPSP